MVYGAVPSGEPAMRLETLLDRSMSPDTSLFPTAISNSGVVDVRDRWGILLSEVFGRDEISIPDPKTAPSARTDDIVAGFVFSILDDLVEVASGSSTGGYIGISGGVAYDLPIVRAFAASCRRRGLTPVLHSRVPPGDGGISIGQAAAGGFMLGR